MVNPQLCVPYFTVQVPLYDGDNFVRVVDRIRRTSGIPGMQLGLLQRCCSHSEPNFCTPLSRRFPSLLLMQVMLW